MISILSIISSKGDILIWEKYRRDVPKDKLNHFTYILLKSPVGSLPPTLEDDGIYCYYIKKDKLYFMMITKTKMFELTAVEFLDKFYCLLGDFCGLITEDTVCKNQALIFELMTEIIDFGHIQTTSLNQLRHFIYSDPVVIRKSLERNIARKSGPFGLEQISTSSNASNRPLVKSRSHQVNSSFSYLKL
ncbi:AP-4 complex subunit mu-1-like [Centruroides sculpturatus]|uniref:AP-4 complex subunit mu-1-like n=1 Tax=Centruroides sculpturatus TaxID=218467 RepID=UPI000C6CA46E|nr:AP-4 complex subunit mu-1-like [Centruroides sculpturatus]